MTEEQFHPSTIRYIKLGKGGEWEKRCIFEDQTIMLGYENPDHLEALAGNWEPIRNYWLRARNGNEGAATRDLNQIRDFYEMPEDCLWITFHNQFLYWCFAQALVTELPDGERIRKTIGKWSNKSLSGQPLHIENLDGRVTKVQAFRGTICSVGLEDYLVRKIRGDEQPDVRDAMDKYEALKLSLEELIRGLWWSDFELLVDLVFAQSGWQRVSVLGKFEKDIDLAVLSPVTGKRAFIQVKSQANLATLEKSISAFKGMPQYDEMYFVVHTTDKTLTRYSEPRINIIDVSTLAELVISAGLVRWLIQKRS
jgi:hypothetical protein